MNPSAFSVFGKSWGYLHHPIRWDSKKMAISWVGEGLQNWKEYYTKAYQQEKDRVDKEFSTLQLNNWGDWGKSP